MKKLILACSIALSATSVMANDVLDKPQDIQSHLCVYASKASSLGAVIETGAGPHVCVYDTEINHAVWVTDPNSLLLNESQREMLTSMIYEASNGA